MWSDTILAAEQRHAVGTLLWGGASLTAGLVLLALLWFGRRRSPLLLHFSTQMALWGAAIAAAGGVRLRVLELRDISSATRLERMLWFSSGVEIGVAAVGIAIALTAWLLGRRVGGVGAGLAIAAHGLALAILDLRLVAVLAR